MNVHLLHSWNGEKCLQIFVLIQIWPVNLCMCMNFWRRFISVFEKAWEREIMASIHWFTSRIPATATAEPGLDHAKIRSPELHPLAVWVAGTQVLEPSSSWFSRQVGGWGEQDLKQSNQNSNQHSIMGWGCSRRPLTWQGPSSAEMVSGFWSLISFPISSPETTS